GQEGLQKLIEASEAGDPYAVIYLDMRMPTGWDGLETAERIREVDTEVRIVLITAYMDYSLTEIRQRIGVNFDFLTKPVDVNELLQLTLSLAAQWSQGRDLVLALEQAQAASKAKDDFLASMSHELRTPLTSIIGNTELMEASGLNQNQVELMGSIGVSSRGLLSLINDILDLSKIESGKFEVDHLDYDLNLLINELNQSFSGRAKESGLALDVVQKEPFPMQFVGDERRIGQILINLMGNAIKFTQEGGVTLQAWVDEERLHFSITDTGIGMSDEVLERLFKPFEQADQSISRRYGGTGLGLHISATLAELMGGSIDVSSEEGVGSCFQFNLPYQLSDQAALPLEPRASQQQVNYFRGHVLVAEDTPELQMMERKILEAAGIEVTIANNGKEAVEHGLATPFDLILMDMQMPEMDGIEATQLMRSVGCETPIVALTANVMQQHREQFETAGCDGFLSKPIDQASLMGVLRQYLAEAEPENSLCFTGQVLVAEDIPELQVQERELLESLGLEVTIASHGNEAVEHGLSQPFDLILMNVKLPEMDGPDAMQLMRSVGCESPIVAMAEDVEQYREQLEVIGCSDLLSKPIERAALIEILEQYLQAAEPGGEVKQQAEVGSFVDEELMQLFVDRTHLQRGLIEQALSEEDWGEVRAIAHTVKGSGATFGFPEITRLGKEICDALDNGEQNPVPALVQELMQAMAEI
ncbi:MAG: response regulator, partial [Gammaproteobacteria bacterium]|nr:response regulator [Gammaproteobacteria bacterium]